MSDIMRPIPFSQLMNWIIEEHKTQDAIFGVRKMVTTNQEGALPMVAALAVRRTFRSSTWPRSPHISSSVL